MQNYNSQARNFKFYVLVLPFTFYLLTFLGCVTAPIRQQQAAFPTYTISGVKYIPLMKFAEVNGVRWDYDTYTQTISLFKGLHKVSLKVGDTLVLVDGKPEHLPQPVDIYQGAVVIPLKAREKLANLFIEQSRPQIKGPYLLTGPMQIRKIVIDAGHGGSDPGAIGKMGVREKDVNLDISKRLAKMFQDSGVEVVMTRTSDRFISLERRVQIANSSGASLFVSIHSNANRRRQLNGFEIYYISSALSDSRRAQTAAASAKLNLNRSCFASDSLSLKIILWDMLYASNRAESIALARSVSRAMERNLEARMLGVKGANLHVLRGIMVPGVLIEIGFVSNPQEEKLLKNSFYRQQIAEAIVSGVRDYSQDYVIMEASR